MLTLVTPSKEFKKSYFSALDEFDLEAKTKFYEDRKKSFDKYLDEIANGFATGMPRSEFWLVDDTVFIGMIQIRHEPPASIPENFSHIYYEIRPSARGKGYGKKILELGLVEAKKLGIKEAILNCNDTNLASKAVIEANHGIFWKSIPFGEKQKLFYRIPL